MEFAQFEEESLKKEESPLNTRGESLKKVESPLNSKRESLKKEEFAQFGEESLKKEEPPLNRFHFPSSIMSFTKKEGVSKICQRILN